HCADLILIENRGLLFMLCFSSLIKKRSVTRESVAHALAFTLALICVLIVFRKPECAILARAR
ncbi:MAG: hypothetical protein VX041_01070, partial [Pseudomonadota bacterium]|nr:hypothetical protein [Pseudomonadota bacterium]